MGRKMKSIGILDPIFLAILLAHQLGDLMNHRFGKIPCVGSLVLFRRLPLPLHNVPKEALLLGGLADFLGNWIMIKKVKKKWVE